MANWGGGNGGGAESKVVSFPPWKVRTSDATRRKRGWRWKHDSDAHWLLFVFITWNWWRDQFWVRNLGLWPGQIRSWSFSFICLEFARYKSWNVGVSALTQSKYRLH
jgi:hypothetical protein